VFVESDSFARLCAARDLLCDLSETPSVREVARRAGVSPFHFIRQMEALFGCTPHQLRVRARLEAAKRELAEGERSVTDVCMALGFSSLGSFSGAFSRRVGVSPSRFRARSRTLVQVTAQLAGGRGHDCFGLMGALPLDAFRNFGEAAPRIALQSPDA
jgi:AraC-like DNA-binding protein